LFGKVHVFRVKPEEELAGEIRRYCREHDITSGVVAGIVGSVRSAKLNYLVELPGRFVTEEYSGPLEIVCAQGTVAQKDDEAIIHVHMQVSSRDICRGGHLAEARIFSTAEVVIAELDYQLGRYADEYTGLNELVQ